MRSNPVVENLDWTKDPTITPPGGRSIKQMRRDFKAGVWMSPERRAEIEEAKKALGFPIENSDRKKAA